MALWWWSPCFAFIVGGFDESSTGLQSLSQQSQRRVNWPHLKKNLKSARSTYIQKIIEFLLSYFWLLGLFRFFFPFLIPFIYNFNFYYNFLINNFVIYFEIFRDSLSFYIRVYVHAYIYIYILLHWDALIESVVREVSWRMEHSLDRVCVSVRVPSRQRNLCAPS